jgi:cyanophycinase-like exopeptidase
MLFNSEVESDKMSILREGVSELELIGNGCVMAIGGNEDKRAARTSILAAFVERAGGADARIVIVPSASVAPRERAQR